MNYTSASEIDFLHELYSQPPAIVAACNRVRIAQERALLGAGRHAVAKGFMWGCWGALIVLAIGWWAR